MNQFDKLQQAALVLKSLPPEQAAEMMDRLDPREVRSVFGAAKEIRTVTAEDLERTLDALDEATRQLQEFDLETTAPAVPVINETDYQPDDSFGFLEDTSLSMCHRLLQDEHPRNIAIVLSHLSPEKASDVLQGFEAPHRAGIVKRLCEQDIESADEAADLSYNLHLRLQKLVHHDANKNEGVDVAAKMLSCVAPELQETLLEYMSQDDPDLVRMLQESIFKFDDIQKLADRDLVTLLRFVNTSYWAVALRVADFATQSKVLRNMAAEPAKLLNKEIALMDVVDNEAAIQAQQRIINTILTLKRQGKIEV